MTDDPKKIYRLLDANFNRVREGLRVCEDVLRFIYDDKTLTQAFKQMRHDVSKILIHFPVAYRDLVHYRQSQSDVGKDQAIQDQQNPKFIHILIGNMKRSQESLRVLEEASKAVSRRQSGRFQTLRFRLYELEKKVLKRI